MQYPKFFDQVESITLYDPLSAVLGTFNDGLVEITYLDVVKAAGHSCPTVAGAYLMSARALEALYDDKTPERGAIKVEFKESSDEGVAGVIANVITHITGATETSGFKGLNGKFARHSLMAFNSNIASSARFTRVDNNASVDLFYNPSTIAPNPQMQPLMQKIMSDNASQEDRDTFAKLWQERVQKILIDNSKNPNIIKVVHC